MSAAPTSRIVGLDIARALAIIGMIVVHLGSLVWSTKITLLGVPSAMFAVIAGITMMIIGRNYSLTTLLRLFTRGALIALIGLALLPFAGDIHVVLVVMGLAMIITAWVPAISLPWKLLAFVIVTAYSVYTFVSAPGPQIYPLAAWCAYFIAGMILYDVYIKIAKPALSWLLTAVSAMFAIIGLYLRTIHEVPVWLKFNGHTGALGEILLSVAITAVVLHLCILLSNSQAGILTKPFAAMGTMSLTTYILHILTAAYWQEHIAIQSNLATFGFIIAFLAFATLWAHFIGQGPVEKLVSTLIKFIVPSAAKPAHA
ncbi:membrane protein [Corynebacterium kutscheri]|nr:membrane protein [Corynebacterium kutscheri]